MKILFIHPNMPGQFKHLARYYGNHKEHMAVFITKPRPQISIPGVHKAEYLTPREPCADTHAYLIPFERATIQGQEVYRMCRELRDEEGFTPDIIVAHPGWGDTLFIKDIYPNTPLLSLFEFYYNMHGGDMNFDPNEKSSEDDYGRIRIKNSTNLFSLQQADWGYCPTFWQKHQQPRNFLDKISVLHEGIDTDTCKPDPNASINLGDIKVSGKDEIITYVARNFEPYRGFPTFIQAAKTILEERPNARIVAIGADGKGYGKSAPDGKTYRHMWLDRLNMPAEHKSRLHFVGHVPYSALINLFQISSAHIYLSFPFVLSWSSLEAMACGACVIGSDTPPVQEIIEHGKTGYLVDFFDHNALAKQVIEVLENKDAQTPIREAARQHVLNYYALDKVLPLQQELIETLAKGESPLPVNEKINALYPHSPNHWQWPEVA